MFPEHLKASSQNSTKSQEKAANDRKKLVQATVLVDALAPGNIQGGSSLFNSQCSFALPCRALVSSKRIGSPVFGEDWASFHV